MKNFEVTHRSKCRLCDSRNLHSVYNLNSQPIGDDYIKNKIKYKNYIP